MPPKPQMIAKQDWRYVSGGGRVLRNAHEASTEITSLAFSSNGNSLASRGADETLKVCPAWLHIINTNVKFSTPLLYLPQITCDMYCISNNTNVHGPSESAC